MIGWCTSYEGTPTTASPPATFGGGSIADGFYREEQGDRYPNAYFFQGPSFLNVTENMANHLGTYTTSGNSLTLTTTTHCDSSGDDKVSDTATFTYSTDGASLYLKDSGGVYLYLRMSGPGDVCTPDGDFKCRTANCVCNLQTGQALTACML